MLEAGSTGGNFFLFFVAAVVGFYIFSSNLEMGDTRRFFVCIMVVVVFIIGGLRNVLE